MITFHKMKKQMIVTINNIYYNYYLLSENIGDQDNYQHDYTII